jgi:thiol-disulfide isomerase/thioredoxin
MKTSEVEEVRDAADSFAGPARRLSLVGSEMEVFGKTLDGADLDWGKYKGKVVLVNFWATWCPGCVEELPNIREAHAKFHEQGFEVVGVNLDKRRIALDQFLERNEVPWPQLHEEGEINKMAVHYDIGPIPFVALVGRDGKVISTDATGRQLHHELEKIFGIAAPTDEASGEAESSE